MTISNTLYCLGLAFWIALYALLWVVLWQVEALRTCPQVWWLYGICIVITALNEILGRFRHLEQGGK